MPRAKLKPTEEDRRKVRTLSACGTEPDDIAKYLGISEKTLQKYYGKDIFRARVGANVKVGKTLFEMATFGGWPTATIFWSKTRGGFREHQEAAMPPPAVVPNFVVIGEKGRLNIGRSHIDGLRCKRVRDQSTEALGAAPHTRTLYVGSRFRLVFRGPQEASQKASAGDRQQHGVLKFDF
jgi:hypothetical protein